MAILSQNSERRMFAQIREVKESSSTFQNSDGLDQSSPSRRSSSVNVGKKRSGSPLVRYDGDEIYKDSSSSGSENAMEPIIPMYKKKRLTAHSYRALLNPNLMKTKKSDATQSSYPETQPSIGCSTCSRSRSDSQFQACCSCDAKAREDLATHSVEMVWDEMKDSTCPAGANLNSNFMKNSSKPYQADGNQPFQTDGNHTICVTCKHPGLLLHCGGKGCKASYHLACLDPPLKDFPLGLWLCFCCLRRKMEFGVYSVSAGIESILDSKDEMQKEKHYFVKYKGLAHVYNLWIPEGQMLLEDSKIIATFNKKRQKEQVKRWKHEWTEPDRLLKKRVLMPPEPANECSCGNGSSFEYCCHEWLVKWKGLGYEHATWEFENSPFLSSDKGNFLINNYERHHEEAKKSSDPSRADKALCLRENPFTKLPKLPDGFPEFSCDHLDSIKSILKFWHRNQNAVVIDDQERIVKSIVFILNLLPYICRPFLIIPSISSLSIWEAEFNRLVPSVNVVVYNGDKNVRKMIQTLEFYEEGGCIMFQVLVATPNVVVEDYEALECIGWEAIIIDDCQMSGISKHFDQFANLSSEFKLLLSNTPLKDNIFDYLNLLSLLDPRGPEEPANNSKFDSIDSVDELGILKERLAQYIAFEWRKHSLNIIEYWVPVQLSGLQHQQYCDILKSNYHSLCSRLRTDYVQALFDVLVSVRKCCDHPYLADDTLERSMTKDLPVAENLDVGVNASGKLQLLDKILLEMKNQSLKVLILFQSNIGSARNRMGDILYDFLCQRFGDESFVLVDSRMDKSKINAILPNFEDVKNQSFIILIENRACRSRIKLSSSVDAVIIYDSDWNPLNDLKALKKISIDSSVKQVKVFRLYSPCTVEEKALMLAKDGGLDVDMENTSNKLKHSLLSWGASYQFSKLEEFQQFGSSVDSQEPSMNNLIFKDVLNLLTRPSVNVDARNGSSIVEAQLSGGSYSSNDLYGEKENLSSVDGEPTIFWSELLEKHSTKCNYVIGMSPRIRRLAKSPDMKSYDAEKKCEDSYLSVEAESSKNQLYMPTEIAVKDLVHEGNSRVAHSLYQEPKGNANSVSPNHQEMVAQSQLSVTIVNEEMEEGEIREDPALDIGSEQELQLLKDKILNKRINYVDKVFSARLDKILSNEKLEVEEFKNKADNMKQKIMRNHDPTLTMFGSNNSNTEIDDAIRKLNLKFSAKMDELDQHIKCQRKNLLVMQIKARNKEKQIKDQWLEEAKVGGLVESFDMPPLSVSGFRLEKFKFSEYFETKDDTENLNLSGPSDASTKSEKSVALLRQSVPAILPNEGIKHILAENEMLLCKSKSMKIVDSTFNNSAANLDGELFDATLDAECSISSGLAVDATDGYQIPVISATNTSSVPCDKLLQNGTPASGCKISSGIAEDLIDSANYSQISVIVSETNPSRIPCDEILPTETQAVCSTDIAACSPDDEMENVLTEPETATCQSKSLKAVDSVEPSTSSPDIASAIVRAGGGNACMGTEAPSFANRVGNVIGDTDSEKSTEQHRDTDFDVVCLTSMQSQTNQPSLPQQVWKCTGKENSVSHDQVNSLIDLDSPDNAIPVVSSSDPEPMQVHCSIHNPEASDPILQQLPASTSLTSVPPSQESSLTLVGCGLEPLNRMGFSRPELAVSTFMERVQSNTPLSQSLRLPSISIIPPQNTQQGSHTNPLVNEMNRLCKQELSIIQSYEEKKMHLQVECDRELEKVRSKYTSLIQVTETEFTHSIKEIDRIRSLIYKNQILADEFREKFYKDKQGSWPTSQGSPSSSTMQQFLQSPSPEVTPRPIFSSPSTSTLAPTPLSISSLRPPTPSIDTASIPLLQPTHQNVAICNNLMRPQMSPIFQGRSEPRAPAPHLRAFRPQLNIQPNNLQVRNPHEPSASASTSLLCNVGSRSFSPINIPSGLGTSSSSAVWIPVPNPSRREMNPAIPRWTHLDNSLRDHHSQM